jgi:hypothetical protein
MLHFENTKRIAVIERSNLGRVVHRFDSACLTVLLQAAGPVMPTV